MDSLESDDQLTIVNGSTEHRISKQLIRKVPYFEKMLSLDLMESKENKVILNFDEKALKSFLNWLELGNIFIEMDYVINLCNMLDYFGLKDHLIQDCIKHFNDNFTIEHLSVVIPQVTSTSMLIDSGTLNAFICRYFTKIVNTSVWLNYHIETIEYICALDLMIHSEYQVFDAIMKWVNYKADSRKCDLNRLLKLVRWCHLEEKDLSRITEQVKPLSITPTKSCSSKKCDCELTGSRTKQEYFIEIYELNATSLRIIISDNNFYPLIERVIKANNSMTIDVLHDEHVSDVFFDSGMEGIQIDWKRNEYRLLDRSQFKTYFIKIHNCIQEKNLKYIIADSKCVSDKFRLHGVLLYEAREIFMLICNIFESVYLPANTELIATCFQTDRSNNSCSTILDDNVYMVYSNIFIKFNIYTHEKTVIELERFKEGLPFGNLIITSRKANDDRVFLIDKSTKDAFCFNVNTQQWSSIGRIIDCDRKFPVVQDSTNKLLTLTSTFISLDTIRICLKNNKI